MLVSEYLDFLLGKNIYLSSRDENNFEEIKFENILNWHLIED